MINPPAGGAGHTTAVRTRTSTKVVLTAAGRPTNRQGDLSRAIFALEC